MCSVRDESIHHYLWSILFIVCVNRFSHVHLLFNSVDSPFLAIRRLIVYLTGLERESEREGGKREMWRCLHDEASVPNWEWRWTASPCGRYWRRAPAPLPRTSPLILEKERWLLCRQLCEGGVQTPGQWF